MVAFPFFLVVVAIGIFVIGAALAGGFLIYRGSTRREPVLVAFGVILLLIPCLIGGGGLVAWLTAVKRSEAVPVRPLDPAEMESIASEAVELPPAERSLIEFRMEAAEDVVDAWKQNGNVPVGTRVCTAPSVSSERLLLGDLPVLDAGDVLHAAAVSGDYDPYMLEITFTERGKQTLAAVTAAGINRRLAIFYRTRLISAPVIREAITGGKAQISGLSSAAERDELIQALRRH